VLFLVDEGFEMPGLMRVLMMAAGTFAIQAAMAQEIPRLWNGDETDYGLNFGGKGSLLRVKLGSY
jgi:hypothetical protein